MFRCVTGLGPSGNDNAELGGLYFNGSVIDNRNCIGSSLIQPRGDPNRIGVINAFICRDLTAAAEGVYTCALRNSDNMIESLRIGVYFTERSKLLPF